MYQETSALEKIRAMGNRIRIVQGGTSAGKTIAILLDELNEAILQPGILTSIVSDTMPNLKRGAMRDFLKIASATNIDKVSVWNRSDFVFKLPNGSVIEFFSTDMFGALGARRDRLFVNEANRISWDTFSQLETRTKQKITIDFNPVNEFWAHTELLNSSSFRPKIDFVKLSYLDNEALDTSIVESIEMRKGDGTSNWWRVYGLGEIGSLEGNIYSGWQVVEEIPEDFRLVRYGVDFGWNDPTSIIAVYENDAHELCVSEKLYESHKPTPELIEYCKTLPEALMICDSARPEVIAEMQSHGLRAIGCDKAPVGKQNSVSYGIDLVQRRKIFYTSTSKDLEREFLTYAWRKKRTGETLDEPEDANNHALDALRYAVMDLERRPVEYAGIRF